MLGGAGMRGTRTQLARLLPTILLAAGDCGGGEGLVAAVHTVPFSWSFCRTRVGKEGLEDGEL